MQTLPPHFAAARVSRFTGVPRWAARSVLAALTILIGYGLLITLVSYHLPAPSAKPNANPASLDMMLYRGIAERVAKGESYYTAAVREHRARGFPLRPFVTVRPPLLATLIGTFGESAMAWTLRALALLTLLSFATRFEFILPDFRLRLAALILLTGGLVIFISPGMAMLHDVWASVLITLSLAIYPYEARNNAQSAPLWIGLAIILGVTAAIMRELCMPYLVVMTAAALYEGRKREATAWGLGLGIAIAALALHAYRLSFLVNAHDGHSPGWASAGGWPFVIDMIDLGSLFRILPRLAVVSLVPLAFIGWIGWRNGFALRVSLWLCGMTAAFMLVGRPDNFYWVTHIAILLPMGLAFAPRALLALSRAAR